MKRGVILLVRRDT